MKRNRTFFLDYTVSGILKELRSYLSIMIMLGLAAFLTATAVGSLTYQPVYESRATIAISERGNQQYYSLGTTSSMASVFSNVFESGALQRKISEAAGEDVNGRISCESVSETNMINLVSRSSDPRQAYLFLQMALQNYQDVSGYVFTDALLNVVQEPSVSADPVNRSPFIRYRLAGTALVVLLVAALAVFGYFRRFTIKSYAGAESQLDGDILGVLNVGKQRILQEKGMKKGSKKKGGSNTPLLLTSSLLSMDFSEHMRMLAFSVEKHMRKKNQKRILVTSVVEHEGKTTFSLNLAIALAQRGNSVIVIEGDLLRATLYRSFSVKMPENCSVTDVLEKKVHWKQALLFHEKSGVRFLLQERPVKDPTKYTDAAFLNQMTREMAETVDYVIIDSSPISVSQEAEVWMQTVDTALIVVRQDWSDVRAVNDAVDLVWQNCGDFAGFALNAFAGSDHPRIQKGDHANG